MKKNRIKSKSTSTKRRVAYSLAAGAAVGAAGVGVSEADAAVVYSGYYSNFTIAPPYGFQPLSLNFAQGNTTTDIRLYNAPNGYLGVNLFIPYGPGKVAGSPGPNGFSYVSALQAGDLIDGSTVTGSFKGYLAKSTLPNDEFESVTNAYIGMSFPEGSDLFYAWIRVDINRSTGYFRIKDWAYNDTPGAAILAGQTVPEPGSLGLLAAGSIGLAALRRRRQAA